MTCLNVIIDSVFVQRLNGFFLNFVAFYVLIRLLKFKQNICGSKFSSFQGDYPFSALTL